MSPPKPPPNLIAAAVKAILPIGDFAIFLTPLTAFFNPFAIPPSKNASLSISAKPPSAIFVKSKIEPPIRGVNPARFLVITSF